jgi:predicted S18 family serine protease
VWPIAGLKEKLLAALRGGIKTVLIPEENAKDLVEISESIKKGLEIVPVSRMDEVLARALTRKPEPIEWDETATTAAAVPEEAPVEEEVSTLNDRDTIDLLRWSFYQLKRRAAAGIDGAHGISTKRVLGRAR